MKKFKGLLLLSFLVLSFLGTVYYLYGKSVEPEAAFSVTAPFTSDIVMKTIASGSISPRREVALKSQVPGVVEALYFEEGDTVETGDLVAKVRLIPNMVQLNTAEADLESARISLRNAELELERNKGLHRQKLVSDSEFQRIQLDFELKEEAVRAAANNLELIREGSASSGDNVSNLVRSTLSGMILELPVKQGAFIIETNSFNEGTTIASVADMTELVFIGDVAESEVGKLSIGMPLSLNVGAIEDERFDARLEFISPKASDDEGVVKFGIRAAIDLTGTTFLRAGYSATADIILDQRKQVLAVKEKDLLFDGDQPYVRLVTGEAQSERRNIEVGLSDGVIIEVVSGLTADDEIVQGGGIE